MLGNPLSGTGADDGMVAPGVQKGGLDFAEGAEGGICAGEDAHTQTVA